MSYGITSELSNGLSSLVCLDLNYPRSQCRVAIRLSAAISNGNHTVYTSRHAMSNKTFPTAIALSRNHSPSRDNAQISDIFKFTLTVTAELSVSPVDTYKVYAFCFVHRIEKWK